MSTPAPEPASPAGLRPDPPRSSGAADRPADDLGGEAACWLARVCPSCGAMTDEFADTCTRCGADLVSEP